MAEAGIAVTGIVDMHAHWYPDGCLTEVIRDQADFRLEPSTDGGQRLTCRGSYVMSAPRGHDDISGRLAVMDQAGVAVQVLSIGALDVGLAGPRAVSVAHRINDAMAEVSQRSKGRFRFVASLALDDRVACVKELDRAAALGAVGVGITTTVGGKSLDEPEFRGFWQEAGRRELVVLVHPTFPLSGPSGDRGEFLTTAYLGETAMAATKVALAGVLEESPGLRLVWSHLGGGLAMLMDRLDRAYKHYPSFRNRGVFISSGAITTRFAPMAPRSIARALPLAPRGWRSEPTSPMCPTAHGMCWRPFVAGPGPRWTSRQSLQGTCSAWAYFKSARNRRAWVCVCQVHKMRNILAKLPRLMQGPMKRLIQQVFLAPSYAVALKRGRPLIARFRDRYPAAMECLERDLEECVSGHLSPRTLCKSSGLR